MNFPQFDADRAMVIGNAKKAGVKKFINPGVDLFSSRQAIELAQKHPKTIFAGVGFHPYEAQQLPNVNELYNLYKNYNRYIVAVGECGLDYHQYKGEEAAGKKTNQQRLFEEQLRLALKHNLPVIMHCRDAYEDFFDVLDSLPQIPKGVIHCFSGGRQDLRMAQARNFFVGIDGNVTYSKHLAMIIPHIPLSMLLLETDAPFLTPAPHRGQRNEPKYIPTIAKMIAELQGVPSAEVEHQTTTHALSLFGMV
ncbi:TatD family hydrolase [Candidatus Gottesmanbacteria bacterium]|nr:TatD family hydrolase [Candidatus Gottesmanbacteria bacterium]